MNRRRRSLICVVLAVTLLAGAEINAQATTVQEAEQQVQEAEQQVDEAEKQADEAEKKAQELEAKIRKQQFDLNDFLEQFRQIKKMGSFSQILGMLPGIDKKMLEQVDTEENAKKMVHIEAIIQSMTEEERRKPSIIGASRKVRIAKGSGTRVQDVNQLLKQFTEMQKMMKQFTGGKQAKMLKRLRKFR